MRLPISALCNPRTLDAEIIPALWLNSTAARIFHLQTKKKKRRAVYVTTHMQRTGDLLRDKFEQYISALKRSEAKVLREEGVQGTRAQGLRGRSAPHLAVPGTRLDSGPLR